MKDNNIFYVEDNDYICITCKQGEAVCEEMTKFLLYIRNEVNKRVKNNVKGQHADSVNLLFISKTAEIIDHIGILIKYSHMNMVKDDIRILFETCTCFKYILKSDKCEELATAYLMESLITRKTKCEHIINEEYLQKRPYLTGIDINKQLLLQEIDAIDKYIDKYEKFKNLKDTWRNNKSWYANMGVPNFRELSKKVYFDEINGELLYEDYYGEYSTGIHAKSVTDLRAVSKGGFSFRKIRFPINISGEINIMSFLANDLCQEVVKEYLNSDVEVIKEFRKYMESHIQNRDCFISYLSKIES